METRSEPRVNITLKIVSEIDKDSKQSVTLAKGNRFEATIFDLTTMGAGIMVKYLLPKGLIIDLEIRGVHFGLKEIMRVKAEVRYCAYIKPHTYKCGVKFLDIPAGYQNTIAKFVSAHKDTKTPPRP